jgi:hypothetical protein
MSLFSLFGKKKIQGIYEPKEAYIVSFNSKVFSSKKQVQKDFDKFFGKHRENLIKTFMGIIDPQYVEYNDFVHLDPKWWDSIKDPKTRYIHNTILCNEIAIKRILSLPHIEKTRNCDTYESPSLCIYVHRSFHEELMKAFCDQVSGELENYITMSGDRKIVKFPKNCPSCNYDLEANILTSDGFGNGCCDNCGFLLFNWDFEIAKKVFYKALDWQNKSGKVIFELIDQTS